MNVIDGVSIAARRASVLQWFLLAVIIVDALGVLAGVSQWALISRAETDGISESEAGASDARFRAIGIVQIVAFVVTAVAWLRWQHRAYKNLTLVGSKTTTHTPGMSVGWWFVPFLNLVRPFQVHREMFRRAGARNQTTDEPKGAVPDAFSAWWGLFIVAGLLGRLGLSLSEKASTIPELLTLTQVLIVGDVVGIVGALTALQVIRLISRNQDLLRVADAESLVA